MKMSFVVLEIRFFGFRQFWKCFQGSLYEPLLSTFQISEIQLSKILKQLSTSFLYKTFIAFVVVLTFPFKRFPIMFEFLSEFL